MPHLTIPVAMLLSGGAAAGTSLAAAKMGSNAASKATATQQGLANEAAARSKPAYDQAYSYYSQLLKGGPAMQQALAPEIGATNQAFDSSRRTAIEGAYSRGGGLDKTLRTNEAGRAFSLADLYGKARPAAASGLAGLAGADTSAAASLLAGANQSAAYSSLVKGQALQGLGGLFTRLLTTPGLFGQGMSAYDKLPQSPPLIPGAVVGGHNMFDPSSNPNPFVSGSETNFMNLGRG